MSKETYKLKSNDRTVFPMPWNVVAPCPWDRNTHMRVVIPMSETERMNSNKTNHIQIVNKNSIKTVS